MNINKVRVHCWLLCFYISQSILPTNAGEENNMATVPSARVELAVLVASGDVLLYMW